MLDVTLTFSNNFQYHNYNLFIDTDDMMQGLNVKINNKHLELLVASSFSIHLVQL